ncbi:MAG: hypothetical protein Q8907_15035, partial [Bacteroidota bacterium]|nr:hypothetical protein [Bacteroidota bacterium]
TRLFISKSMIKISAYCLPDIKLLEESNTRYLIWIPDKPYIVLGASNHPEDSLNLENVLKDNITVLKRPSGGQAVVLTPNNLIISVVITGEKTLKPKDVFHNINSLLISAMKEAGIDNLSLMGISDIALSGKKISGSAIYRNKEKLLYHAVLNLCEPASTFERYLKHPLKEPFYRNGRKHIDFVISLKEKGYIENDAKLSSIISYVYNSFSKVEWNSMFAILPR